MEQIMDIATNQDEKEFSRISVIGSETGPITGVQNIHADRNSTINLNIVPFQNAMLQPQKQHNVVNNFTRQLKRIYQTKGTWIKPLPWIKEQHIENYYVDLNLELLDATGRKRLATLSQLQDILRDEPSGLVTPAETILLSGPSGSGKTTLLRKMASLWASDNSPKLNKFKVLLIYSLKDLRDSEDLEEAITTKLQLFYQESSLVSLEIWLQEVKDDMLLLLDGYDELSENGKANFGKILQKNSSFFSSTIIVTTRLCHDLELNKRFVKHVTVSCLTDNSLNEGIDRYFSEDERSKQLVKKSVLTNKGCTDLFRTSPLLMYSLCYVFEAKEIANIIKLTDLCFHVVTNLLKRAAMEEGNHLTEEDILRVLNCLGEISAKQLFKGKIVYRLADLESRCPDELNVILRSGLFLQKEKPSQVLEILHNLFTESLGVRYWNNQFPAFRGRRCILLNEILCKQNYFKSWLLITRNNEMLVAFQTAGMYLLVKHGDSGIGYVLETEYDFVVFKNNCDWRYSVRLSNRWLHCFLFQKQGTADLLEIFLTVLSENKRHKTFIGNVLIKASYCVHLLLIHLKHKYRFYYLTASQYVFTYVKYKQSETILRDENSHYVGYVAILLSQLPFVVISAVLLRYGGNRPIIRQCANTFFSTLVFTFYYCSSELNDSALVAFLAYKKTKSISSATLLTTSLLWNKFSDRLFLPLSFVACFKLLFTTDFPANRYWSSKIQYCVFPGAIVSVTSILIRQCYNKWIKYYL